MRRRTLLSTVVAALTSAAGCAGGGDPGTTATTTPTTRESAESTTERTSSPTTTEPTTTTEQTTTQTPTPTAEFTLEQEELIVRERDYTTDIGAVATVVNDTEFILAEWEIRAAFLDDSGSVIETSTERLTWLPGGDRWQAHIGFFESQVPSDVVIEVTDVTPTTVRELDLNPVTGTQKVTSELLPPEEYTGPRVVGEIANERSTELSYLQATVLFGDGSVWRGSGFDNVSNLPAERTWEYSVEYFTAPIEDGTEISTYRVLVSD